MASHLLRGSITQKVRLRSLKKSYDERREIEEKLKNMIRRHTGKEVEASANPTVMRRLYRKHSQEVEGIEERPAQSRTMIEQLMRELEVKDNEVDKWKQRVKFLRAETSESYEQNAFWKIISAMSRTNPHAESIHISSPRSRTTRRTY